MRYLDPKADLPFKKVFGEHHDLVISFLNALLPFESAEEEIKSVEYLAPELVPNNPLWKDSVVDVRCRDGRGRQFIVEMQMMWTSEYKQRVLFNASKAYVRQLERGRNFSMLQPVYSLNMVNDTFSDSEDYYHDYRIVESADTKQVIEGLRFIFIELPKFTPKNFSEKKMKVLWLRYLTEIDEKTRKVSPDLTGNPEIGKAIEQIEEAAFTDDELYIYDRFWDMVSTAKMQITSSRKDGMRKGLKEGMEKGMEKGMKEGIEKGMKEGMEKGIEKGIGEERIRTARKMKAEGLGTDMITKITGLTPNEIDAL